MSRAVRDKTLILMRHARAQDGLGRPDHDRELTTKGRRDAAAAGRWLAKHGLVADLVLCSTATRTRQTWEHAVLGGGRSEAVEFRRSVYAGGSAGVLDCIREEGGDCATILVVGHAPTMPALASALSEGVGSRQAHEALGQGFPTTGVAVLRHTGEWSLLGPGTCRLERFHVGRA